MLNKYADRYKRIGKHIQQYRKEKGLTQEQLSEQVRISKSYLSKIEAQNCNKSFSLEVLFEIADALEIPVYKLLE
ncbi:MAG TPA: helix-turn-helix transcriptional regulator [Pseudobacteroides sp.]|nr:helix-turn-helix transcriptional regulator [Pseudobacteroides sp.]